MRTGFEPSAGEKHDETYEIAGSGHRSCVFTGASSRPDPSSDDQRFARLVGKVTIEVRVDMAAEVDVYGNSGRLRTMAGQPATWARMDCTDPLPYNMSRFSFQGNDGRGQVKLVQDPRNNNGMAVIRIDDPKSGSEGYTFDIEWSGASGGTPTQGFQTDVNNPATRMNNPSGTPGGYFPGRRSNRAISAERAIDLCRTEVRTRAERDYNIRNIDITAAAVDATAGRSDWITW